MAKKKTQETEEVLIGIDYGEKNIGIAFAKNGIVSPTKVISGTRDEVAITEIARFVLENKVTKIIVGLPLTSDGKDTNQSRKVRRFVKLLKIRLKKPVEFVNEFRTTKDSITEAINLGISKKRRSTVDHLSAALILKEYYSKVVNP